MKFWYALGVASRLLLTAAVAAGAVAGYLLLTKLAPFRYMEL